jgi:hypothetical protein
MFGQCLTLYRPRPLSVCSLLNIAAAALLKFRHTPDQEKLELQEVDVVGSLL